MKRHLLLFVTMVMVTSNLAISTIQAEVKDTPEGRSAYAFDQAIQFYLKGDSGKAISHLNESLKILPTNKRARVFLLKILVERGSRLFLAKKFKKAHTYLSQAYHMDPENRQVQQMFELAAKHVNPPQKTSQVMLIPDEMKKEMLKQEAEQTTRQMGGAVMKTVKTPDGQEQRVVRASAPVYNQGQVADRGNRDADYGQSNLMAEYAKNVSMMTELMATFTQAQEAQMSQFMAPLERIQNLYYQSEEDRQKFMNRLDNQFKNVLGDVSFQQRMVIYGFIIGLMLLGGLAYIFYLIIKRMRSKREETIMKYQQEMLKMVRDMAGLPGGNTYGMLGSGGMAGAGYRLNPGMPQQQQLMPGQQPMGQPPMPTSPPVNSQPYSNPQPSGTNQSTPADGEIITEPSEIPENGNGAQQGQPGPGFEIEQVIQTGNYKERSLAALQLMEIDVEKALDYIKLMTSDADPFQRESIVFALGEKYHPLTVELVIEALKDSEKRVVDAGLRALKRLEQSSDESMTDQVRLEISNAVNSTGKTKKSRKKAARSKQS